MACRALVFGGSRGVGYYSAEALAGMGCSVRLVARGREGLEEAARRLRSATGADVGFYTGDLRREEGVLGPLRSAASELGGLDVVVVSYGNPSCEPCLLGEARWGDWLEAAAMYLAATATILSWLGEENSGQSRAIVYTSFTARESHDYLVVADAARAGVPLLVRAAARRYAPKLIPVAVVLGSIDTPGARRTVSAIAGRLGRDPGEFWASEVEAASPLGRTATPRELGELVSFLARAPEYMAGSVVYFDGATARHVP